MSEVVGEGVIHIRTDSAGVDVAGAGATAGKGYTRGFLGSLKGLALGIGGVIAAREVIGFAKEAVAEGREAQKVGAATEQIIKSTGAAANVTSSQVSDLATSLSLATGQDDELIQSGANLLLTFKNVRNEAGKNNDVFNQAVEAAQDVSAAGFGSIESASKGLGKALNDPVKGISALGRAGVTFTASQQEQIKRLVEQNDLLGAQKIILGEVQSQVGGVAEATATSGEKASVAWANLKETIGTALLPTLDRVEEAFAAKIVPAITDVVTGSSKVSPALSAIGDAVGSTVGVISEGFNDLQNGVKVFRGVLSGEGGAIDSNGPFVKLGLVLGDLVRDALPKVTDFVTGTALPVIRELAGAVGEFAGEVLPVMADTFQNEVLPAIIGLASYAQENLLPLFLDVVDIVAHDLVPTLASIAVLIYGTVYPAVVQIVTAVATQLKPVFDQLIATFRRDVLPTLSELVTTIRTQLIPALQPIVEKVLVVVGAVLKLAAAILAKVLPPIIQLAGFLIRNLVPIIAQIIVKAVQFVGALLSVGQGIGGVIADVARFIGRLAELYASFVDNVLSLPGKIIGMAGAMLRAGKRFIGGLLDGILDAASGVGGVVADIASGVKDAVVGVVNDAIDLINNGIPDKIAIPGAPDIDLPNDPIPHLARGTASWPGGWSWVGEEGPELVNVPRGAQVVPAGASASMARGGGAVIHVEHMHVTPHNYSEFVRDQEADARVAALGNRRPGSVRPVFST